MSKIDHIHNRSITREKYRPEGNVYFLGIGGIGMSALARYFNQQGVKVSGYDKTSSVLTRELEQEGIKVHYVDDLSLIDKDASLVVFTPAVPKEHKELEFYRKNGYNLKKRSEVLGMITRSSYNICVAGTHGKTTTSAMIAHLLRHSGFGCTAFLGGIAANYNSNFWSSDSSVCVAEADEYDRSFLQLNPDVAVITSMDADHLDIYGSEKNMQDAFIQFSKRIKKDGSLISRKGLAREQELIADKVLRYSSSDITAGAFASDIAIENGSYKYNITVRDKRIQGITLNMGGIHNVENSVAAVAVAVELGIEDDKIKSALTDFKGVKRRFEYIIRDEKMVFIDDYAHHPEELRALLNGVRDLYPDRKITMVFQPHLYSRTRDLADAFAEVLKMADKVLLLPIYPARELPLAGVDSNMLAERINDEARVVEMNSLPEVIGEMKPELLVTAGAGDIDTMLESIRKVLV
ncbi:MAG: UDP-N-acetylmuramate--L-alanine ligase [Chitinophagaceae bacterium]|nr:MAG: UDP-N-acetylmuramate--L-alanine ligase [Chitinophagaceae bacterium]